MLYSMDLVRRIAEKHGLDGEPALMPNSGMMNEAWAIGNQYVLRIATSEEFDGEAAREAVVVPLVRAAGVRSPQLIVADLSCEIAPRPFTIYERAPGVLLGLLQEDPVLFAPLYRELGREFALLAAVEVTDEVRIVLHADESRERPKKSLEGVRRRELLSADEIREIEEWFDRLEATTRTLGGPCLTHADSHPWNVFADAETRQLTAIIDWGDTTWGDPAIEFASMPFVAVPPMLEGYIEAGGVVDQGFVTRALFASLRVCMWELCNLEPSRFDRRWWRMPPGGWPEARDQLERCVSFVAA